MLFIGFFKWWYGAGWLDAAGRLKDGLQRLYLTFSVPMLLKSLFKPWRQIIAPKDPNAQIGLKVRGAVDNLISRFIGFWVRLLTILTALGLSIVIASAGLVMLVVWPLLPALIVWLFIKGIGV